MNADQVRHAASITRPSLFRAPRRHRLARMRAVRGAAAALAMAVVVLLTAAPGRAQGPCVGDCQNQGVVTVADMVLGVNIVLGNDPPSACPNFQNSEGVVDIAQLVKGVSNLLNGCSGGPTPTPTPIFSGKERHFVIASGVPNTSGTITGLFTSGLPNNVNAATAVCGKLATDGQSCATSAEMTLILDDEDMGDGIHDMPLKDDVNLEIGIVDGSRVCLKFIASLTEGYIACQSGTSFGIDATRPAGAPGVDFTYTRNQGPPAAAGNANLLVSSFYKHLSAGDTTPCAQVEFTGTIQLPFTTTTGTATITGTDLSLSVSGKAFSCDNFDRANSGGILTAPIPANQPPVGDVVNALRFGEKAP